jgi:hypothetical protein
VVATFRRIEKRWRKEACIDLTSIGDHDVVREVRRLPYLSSAVRADLPLSRLWLFGSPRSS